MQRVRDIVGKPVVSAEDGSSVGTVTDLLLDSTSNHIVGLVLGGGLLRGEQVLPFTDVQTVGSDAVIARTTSGVLDVKGWRERAVETVRSSSWHHKRIVTDRGRELGRVRDLTLDETSGAIEAVEMETGGFAGMMQRRHTIPHAALVFGPDALVISDEAARHLESERQDRQP